VLGTGEKQALRSQLADAEARLRSVEAELEERRNRDPRTRLFVHDAFRRAAIDELGRADRDGRTTTLALVDIDGFRALNARRGVEAGDAALSAVALRLRRLTRASDVLGRTGADEIAVLMSGTDLHGAQACCERLIAELEAGDLPGAGYVTVSAGVAAHVPGGSLDHLLVSAALGLDRARSLGGAQAAVRLDAGVQDPNPAHAAVVEALAMALLERDRYTGEHSESVVEMARSVASTLGLDDLEVERVAMAALLHDIGKVAIPDRILLKPGKLDDSEWELMREHPAIGERILRAIPGMGAVARIVRHEHEHFDGSGYPDGLRGEEIPIGSRIILACDTYSAMTTTRPYRDALTHGDAVTELARCAGTQFDPKVTEALIGCLYWMAQNRSAGRAAAPSRAA
jgi:diguanylate cyclase (GGDEF)-like protein/putative nucleotidyltransferase with HDIG domain